MTSEPTDEPTEDLFDFTQPEYLGDAVCASWDGYQIKLWTGDGNHQVIYLDSTVQKHRVGTIERIAS